MVSGMTKKRRWLAGALLASLASACTTSPSLGPADSNPTAEATTTEIPSLVSGTIAYDTPAAAARSAALADNGGLVEPQVSLIVGIYADEYTVDLRVQLQADEFCQWYGVLGAVEGGALRWRASPALPCGSTG
jgi:hypothetical protein